MHIFTCVTADNGYTNHNVFANVVQRFICKQKMTTDLERCIPKRLLTILLCLNEQHTSFKI